MTTIISFLFADIEPDACPLQQQQAMQLVLSILGLFLEQINRNLTQLSASLDGTTAPVEQVFLWFQKCK